MHSRLFPRIFAAWRSLRLAWQKASVGLPLPEIGDEDAIMRKSCFISQLLRLTALSLWALDLATRVHAQTIHKFPNWETVITEPAGWNPATEYPETRLIGEEDKIESLLLLTRPEIEGTLSLTAIRQGFEASEEGIDAWLPAAFDYRAILIRLRGEGHAIKSWRRIPFSRVDDESVTCDLLGATYRTPTGEWRHGKWFVGKMNSGTVVVLRVDFRADAEDEEREILYSALEESELIGFSGLDPTVGDADLAPDELAEASPPDESFLEGAFSDNEEESEFGTEDESGDDNPEPGASDAEEEEEPDFILPDSIFSEDEDDSDSDGVGEFGEVVEGEDEEELANLSGFSEEEQEKAQQLMDRIWPNLVIIDSSKVAGSGFLCAMGEADFLVSNAHVIAGDQQLKFTTVDGDNLLINTGELAFDHDVMRFEFRDGPEVILEAVEDLPDTIDVGDTIIVPGNAEGVGVVRPLMGRILGIGPDQIEVDAHFQPGNSGSPIIHLESGLVIGIATAIVTRDKEAFEDPETEDAQFQRFRRLGFRLDSIEQWEKVSAAQFYAQASEVEEIQDLTSSLLNLLADIQDDGEILQAHNNPAIKQEVRNYVSRVSRTERVNSSDLRTMRLRLLAHLRSVAKQDISRFPEDAAYDYFRDIVTREKEVREEIHDYIDQVIKSF